MESINRRVLIAGMLIMAGYMVTRAMIYHAFGPLSSFEAWSQRDTFMSAPRVLGFILCLWISYKNGGIQRWGWRWQTTGLGLAVLLAAMVTLLLHFIACTRMVILSRPQLVLGWETTLAVALFEETCFRGLLFLSLESLIGTMNGALASSALFAIYHWQAQPMGEWPLIFLYGVLTCGALWLGVGLPWLVVAHEIVDSLWFHFGTNTLIKNPSLNWISLTLAAITSCMVLYSMWKKGQGPPSGLS